MDTTKNYCKLPHLLLPLGICVGVPFPGGLAGRLLVSELTPLDFDRPGMAKIKMNFIKIQNSQKISTF